MSHLRIHLRGAALMMVLVLLSLLLILAVSFAFLMTQQEGTSVASLAGEETRIVTRTGADHAYARLNRTNRLNEFAAWWNTRPADVTNDGNPWLDDLPESVVDLLTDFEGAPDYPPLYPGLMQGNQSLFRVEDPRRLVLGVNVHDESGKVNLNFANPQLIANILGSTTTANPEPIEATGDVYDQVLLHDAEFLTPYDEDANPNDNIFGGGLVVIDGGLFSYARRVGRVLYTVIPNPPYNGPGGRNALFRYWDPDVPIAPGAFVTTPTPYKVAYRRYLVQTGNGRPALYNTLGEVRAIAEMPRWFNPAGILGPFIMGEKVRGWPEGLDPAVFQRLDRLATVVAPTERFDGGWFYPHVVLGGDMVPEPTTAMLSFGFNYDNRSAFQASFHVPRDPRSPNPNQLVHNRAGVGAGNLVRFSRPGEAPFYGVIGGQGALVAGQHRIDWSEPWIMEVAERAPVNINTAPLEVLEALFHGVGPRGKDPDERPIHRRSARRIALELLQRIRGAIPEPFVDLDDLGRFLTELSQRDESIINPKQLAVFMGTQQYPYSPGAAVTTAPVAFATQDVYMVDAFATRYQPAGGAMARRAFREWVSIGSDRPQEFIWRGYERWLDEMRRPQGNIIGLYAGGTENGRMIAVHELPFVHYQPDERYIRPRIAPPWNAPQPRNVFELGNDARRPERFYSNVDDIQMPDGQVVQAGDLEGGMFSFWYRPQWAGQNTGRYLFDCAQQEYSNRISLLWWGDRRRGHKLARRNSGLVFRVKDRTLEEAFTELRYELDADTFRQNEWYHMALNWKGTHLSHLNLLLDGDCIAGGDNPVRPVANHTFRQINGAWVSRTSTLEMDLEDPRFTAMTQTEIYLDPDDIRAFPDRGVVLIGEEAIEYNGNNGQALLNINRGPPLPNQPVGSARGNRGTTAGFHPRGSKVTVFGYTTPIRSHDPGGQGPRFPFLPATGGMLRSDMGNQGIARVSRAGTTPLYFSPPQLAPDAGFPGAGDDQRGGDPNYLPLADYAAMPARGVVGVYGFAWRGYLPPGTPGIPQAGVSYPDFMGTGPNGPAAPLEYPATTGRGAPQLQFEYVAYDRIDSQGLHVVARYHPNFVLKDPAEWLHFMGTYPAGFITPTDPSAAPVVSFFSAGSAVVPVSIDITSVAGYHNRSYVQIDDEWFFYNRVWDYATRPDTDLLTLLLCINSGQLQAWISAHAAADNKNPGPWPFFRGREGTGTAVHPAERPVTPVFATTVQSGEADVVTAVINKNSLKELHTIRRWRRVGNGNDNMAGTLDDVCLAALYMHTRSDFLPNPTWNPAAITANPASNNYDPYTRGQLCKFPTGELPVELPTTWTFAGQDPRAGSSGTHSGDFDSFELRRYNKGHFVLMTPMNQGTPREGGEIQVNTQLPPNLGVVKINDELVAYRDTAVRQTQVMLPNGTMAVVDTYWLVDITRGILGTRVGAHSAGTQIMNMASMRVARPQGQGGGVHMHTFQTVLGEESLRPYGYFRIEEAGAELELVGYQKYTERATRGPQGQMLRTATIVAGQYFDPRHPQALFRGMYGTRARAFSERALFFDQPVRFPDFVPNYHQSAAAAYGLWHSDPRFGIPGAVSPEAAYLQGAATFRGGVFHEFKWRMAWLPHAQEDRHADALGARMLVRFRQREPHARVPEWGEMPTNQPGGLYAFEFDWNGPNTQSLEFGAKEQTESLGDIRAEGIEWRLYLYHKRDAFKNEDYKATLQFQGASAVITQITQILRHEEQR